VGTANTGVSGSMRRNIAGFQPSCNSTDRLAYTALWCRERRHFTAQTTYPESE